VVICCLMSQRLDSEFPVEHFHSGPGFDSRLGPLSVRSLHVLPCLCGFPTSPKAVLVSHAKFSLSVPDQECGD